MIISHIVAASENNVIGKNNALAWHLPNDMKYFKNTTWGMPVIMGRKTYNTFNKPLPGRINIVITRQQDWVADGVFSAPDLESAIQKAANTNCKEVFIIGGGEIYRQSMGKADRIYMTRVHAVIDGDTFFPVIDGEDWTEVSHEDFPADEKHGYAYSFEVWEKKEE